MSWDPTIALYELDAGSFLPGSTAGSPWSAQTQHGGPASALLARCLEGAADSGLAPVRLTVDLSRPLPKEPVEVVVEPVRVGRRIAVLDARIVCGGRATSFARGLFLQPSRQRNMATPSLALEPPGEIEVGPLVSLDRDVPRGFHSSVEVGWLESEGPRQSAWFRLPMPVVEGEKTTPFVRVAAVSDFANALARLAVGSRLGAGGGFINTDLTVHLTRMPVGEWIGMRVEHVVETVGLGFAQVTLHDVDALIGVCTESRLAN